MSLFRIFYDSKWSCQNFCKLYFQKIPGTGRGIQPLVTLNLKKELKLMITNAMSHSEVFTITLSIQALFPQSITYNSCPEGSGEDVLLINNIFGPFIYVEQNAFQKKLIGCAWGNFGFWRGVCCPPITFDY